MFAHVGANCAPIDSLVCVPVGAMPYALAASSAAGFATVADLLVVGDLAAIHLTSPLYIASDGARTSDYLVYADRTETKKAN